MYAETKSDASWNAGAFEITYMYVCMYVCIIIRLYVYI